MNISVHNVSKTYPGGVHALRSIDLCVERGMIGLLGPNGAGKTTLMRILAGILHQTSGQVRIGGHDMGATEGRTAVKRVLGYLPQELGLYPDLRGHEFLDYIGILKELDDTQTRRRRVEELLDMVGLAEAADRKIKTYSGGMKRRLGIAQALLNDPRLLIVDEPTAGLDPEERIRFRNLLSDLAGDRTVLLSTHVVEDIAQTCHELAVLLAGRLVFSGTVLELIERARGNVWMVTTSGGKPEGDSTIVSTLNLGTSVQYRVVGPSPSSGPAAPTEPSLEDGYVWLMRQHRVPPVALAS